MDLYCLDSNFFIKPWHDYYPPDFCGQYWEVLCEIFALGQAFIPQAVLDEILKVDDDLTLWLVEESGIAVESINENVTKCLSQIYEFDESHHRLVDSIKQRSLADPWVIAHAMAAGATVVTKEAPSDSITKRIKIPDVCNNMGIRCVNDFDFIREVGIAFSCSV